MLDPCLYSGHLEYPRRQNYGAARAALLDARGAETLDAEVAERLAADPDRIGDADAVHFREARQGTKYALIDLETGLHFPLRTGLNTIGRYHENDIVIDINAVSRRHCVILVHANGSCELHDTASRNGTFVNHVLVRAGQIPPGAVISIIKKRFMLVVDDDRRPAQFTSIDSPA